MQRLLSLGTLGVLGGLVWMFLTGGGLEDLGNAPGEQRGPFAQQGAPWGQNQAQPPMQPAPPLSPGASNPATRPPSQPRTPAVPVSSQPPVPNFNNGPTIRIASYNIQVFGKSKVAKAEGRVIQTLAAIVRLFDVVAIQEIRTQDPYHIPHFVDLINSDGSRYDYIVGPRLGNTRSKEQYAYIFNTRTIQADFQSKYTVSDPDNLLHREPLVATFYTRVNPDEAFSFTLVNIHTDPDVAKDEMDVMAQVYRAVRKNGGNEDDVIILGDMNVDDRTIMQGRIGQIPGLYPLIKGVFTNTRQNKLYDNIIINQASTVEYAGRSGVFDVMRYFNLTQEQALMVSDHFPVWAEFSAYERDYSGNVASRAGLRR